VAKTIPIDVEHVRTVVAVERDDHERVAFPGAPDAA
jgi:hypothetical protein